MTITEQQRKEFLETTDGAAIRKAHECVSSKPLFSRDQGCFMLPLARFGDKSKYGKRHKPGEMNLTESRFAELLQARKLCGEIIEWMFESTTLKLAEDCRYTPDFLVLHIDCTMEFVDVKGSGPMDEKSRVKVKCAAEKFFCFKFTIAKQRTKKNGGGFSIESF